MLKPIENRSVGKAIKEQIMTLIVNGELVPGSRLPSEKEMTRTLSVSRPALREAIRTMVGEGLLEIRPGLGTFVREPTSAAAIRTDVVTLLLMADDLAEIQEVREMLEPAVAARVAERASEESFDQLDVIIDEMEKARSAGRIFFELAWDFHRHVASAAGNAAVTTIIDVIYEMIRTYERPLYECYFEPQQEIEEHSSILRALRTRNPEVARSAMAAHIEATSEKLNRALADAEERRKEVLSESSDV